MRHRDIAGVVSTTAPVLSRHDVTLPIVFPASSDSVSITSRMTRRICFSKYRGISRLLFCQNKPVQETRDTRDATVTK